MEQHEGAGLLVQVRVPDLKSQTKVVISQIDTIYAACQVVLDRIGKEMPHEQDNYGLYIPQGDGRVGKFLDETRSLNDYSMEAVPYLEIRYKLRDYGMLSLSEKQLAKANTKSSQRKLIDHISSGSIKKVEKLLDSGIDPNYICDDGNTPLGMACGRNGHVQCIPQIIAGGAHIDFRGSGGLTPIHRAAIGGNALAIKALLSRGSSPNYLDAKGLTPLYHTAIMGDDVTVCETLLKQKSIVGTRDLHGWTELHQIAKHGHEHMVDIMCKYNADINAKNQGGNTPLHVAAQHGMIKTAIIIMTRGADRRLRNASNQTPNQVAIMCGHHQLAKEIVGFDESTIEPLVPKTKKPINDKKPAGSTLPKKTSKQVSSQTQPHLKSRTLPRSRKPDVTEVSESEGYGSGGNDQESNESSQGGSQTPPANSKPKHRYQSSRPAQGLSAPDPSLSPRERLYACTQGKKYVVTADFKPQREGDLPLSKGMEVEVLYVGKGGFWEGQANGERGWFPQNAIKIRSPEQIHLPQSATNTVPVKADAAPPNGVKVDIKANEKENGVTYIEITRSKKGYGFGMKGVKAMTNTFTPNPQVPGLQYVRTVDKDGPAALAGLHDGDFLIEVNGHNTIFSTHEEVVALVKQTKEGILKLKVVRKEGQAKPTSKHNKSANNNNSIAASQEQVVPQVVPKAATVSPMESPLFDQKNLAGWDGEGDELPVGQNSIKSGHDQLKLSTESPLVNSKQAERITANTSPARVDNAIEIKTSQRISESLDDESIDSMESSHDKYSSPTTLTPEGESVSGSGNNSPAYYSSRSSSPDLSFFEPNSPQTITGGIDYDMDEDEDWTEVVPTVALKSVATFPSDTDPCRPKVGSPYNKKQTEKPSSFTSKESLSLLDKFKAKQMSTKPLEPKKPPISIKSNVDAARENYAAADQPDEANLQESLKSTNMAACRLDKTNSRIIVEESSPVSSLRDRFEKLSKASITENSKSKSSLAKKSIGTSVALATPPKSESEDELSKLQDVHSNKQTDDFYPPPPEMNDTGNVRASVSSFGSDIPLPDDILQELGDFAFQKDEASATSLDNYMLPPPSSPLEMMHSNINDGDAANHQKDSPANEDDDLLDNIVGQLKQLTKSPVEEEDDYSDAPPPPPSCPPPEGESSVYVGPTEDDHDHIMVLPDPVDLPDDLPNSNDFPIYTDLPDPVDFPTDTDTSSPQMLDFPDLVDDSDREDGTFLPPPAMDFSYECSDDEVGDVPNILPPPIENETSDIEEPPIMPEPNHTKNGPNLHNVMSTDTVQLSVESWSVDEVCNWLVDIGLGSYCHIFQENEIIGEHLGDLSRDDLKDLGITKIGLLCDLLWADPDKDVIGWGENDKLSFTFGPEIVQKFLCKHDFDLICRGNQMVEDGYEFFAKRQLVTLFSAPNHRGQFDNAAAMMSVDETLICSFQILRPVADRRKFFPYPEAQEMRPRSKLVSERPKTRPNGEKETE